MFYNEVYTEYFTVSQIWAILALIYLSIALSDVLICKHRLENMPDKRPISVLNRLKNARRNIETVIGQLSQRFNMQKVSERFMAFVSQIYA